MSRLIPKHARWIKKEEGMTLVEILATIFILSIIVTGFTVFFINSSRATTQNERQTRANYYTQELLEQAMYEAERSTDREDFLSNLVRSDEGWERIENGLRNTRNPEFDVHFTLEVPRGREHSRVDNPHLYNIIFITRDREYGRQLNLFESSIDFDEREEEQ